MMPALFTRISSRFDAEVNRQTAAQIEPNDERLGRWNSLHNFRQCSRAASPFEGVRDRCGPWDGLCLASWRIVSLPRLVLPVRLVRAGEGLFDHEAL